MVLEVIFPSMHSVLGSTNAPVSMGERAWQKTNWVKGRPVFLAAEI